MRLVLLVLGLLICEVSYAKSLTLCYEEWSPYASREGDADKGIVLEKLSHKAATLNWELTFFVLPHNRCVHGVESGRYDGAIFVDPSDGLTLVSEPVAYWKIGFAVADTHPAKTTSDVHYGVLILAKDYDYPELVMTKLSRLPLVKKRIQYYSQGDANTRGLFNYIIKGQADVMLVDEVWANQMKSKLRLKIRMLEPAVHVEPQYIGIKTDSAQRKALQSKLAKLLSSD